MYTNFLTPVEVTKATIESGIKKAHLSTKKMIDGLI